MRSQAQNKKFSELSSRVESNAISTIKVIDGLYDQIDLLNRNSIKQQEELSILKLELMRNSSIIDVCTEMLNVLRDEIKILKFKTSTVHQEVKHRSQDEKLTEDEKTIVKELNQNLEIFKTNEGFVLDSEAEHTKPNANPTNFDNSIINSNNVPNKSTLVESKKTYTPSYLLDASVDDF